MDIILTVLGAFVAALVIIILKQPDEFRVTRSRSISAPPSSVFPHVNDLEKWQAWSPWAKMDPEAKMTYEGPKAGVGAKLYWEGKKTGKGCMEIIESRAKELVKYRLEFVKPMKAVNVSEIEIAPEGAGSLVTWTMYGPNNFIGKAMGLVMNCDKMAGGQFEEGLANIDAVAKAEL